MKTRIDKFDVEHAFIDFAKNIAKYDVRDDDICDYVSHIAYMKRDKRMHVIVVNVMRTQREYTILYYEQYKRVLQIM